MQFSVAPGIELAMILLSPTLKVIEVGAAKSPESSPSEASPQAMPSLPLPCVASSEELQPLVAATRKDAAMVAMVLFNCTLHERGGRCR